MLPETTAIPGAPMSFQYADGSGSSSKVFFFAFSQNMEVWRPPLLGNQRSQRSAAPVVVAPIKLGYTRKFNCLTV